MFNRHYANLRCVKQLHTLLLQCTTVGHLRAGQNLKSKQNIIVLFGSREFEFCLSWAVFQASRIATLLFSGMLLRPGLKWLNSLSHAIFTQSKHQLQGNLLQFSVQNNQTNLFASHQACFLSTSLHFAK